VISQRSSKIGIKNLKSVTENDLFLEAEIDKDKQFSKNINLNDTSTLLNMGETPKADIFKSRIKGFNFNPLKTFDSTDET
jgi:hypothetical protein